MGSEMCIRDRFRGLNDKNKADDAAVMAGIIYPISMGWQWGGGWLSAAGFSDFAGSTLVHACGGAAALAGVIVLGPRSGRFSSLGGKRVMVPFAASSIPLVTLGTFLLWFGWFGFNGFSQLAMGTFDDVNACLLYTSDAADE